MYQRSVLLNKAENLFLKQIKKARQLSLPLPGRDRHRLPSLDRLVQIMPPKGESDLGIREIPVNLIIGSEGRADDFIGDFLPRRSWMLERWQGVLIYLEREEGVEPIEVIEYGGYYFVRDGNHRVSVAKATEREFLSAHVRKYNTPLKLPRRLDGRGLTLFREQLELHRRTELFRYIDEDLFDVRKPGTWSALGREIFEYNHDWFLRKNGREPDSPEELVNGWNKNLYGIALNHIRTNSLHYLLPRWGSTDIFIDFVRFWNNFPDPDSLWLGEVYELYSARKNKSRFFLSLLQRLSKASRFFFESKEEGLERFKEATRQEDFVPDFVLPSFSKRLIRYLYRQVYFQYALYLKKKLKRAPYIQELTVHWYENYYAPLFEHYKRNRCRWNFTGYYIRFSRQHFASFMNNPKCLESLIVNHCSRCAYTHSRDSENRDHPSPRST